MGKLTAGSFDRNYVNEIGVAAHRDTVALFEKTARSAHDPDVKAFAAKTLPDLKHPLDMAKTLQSGMAKR